MDVRLSPEQSALRDSVAQVADRLGPGTVGRLDEAERVLKLDAAVAATGWRDLRAAAEDGHPWASGVEVAVVAEQLGRRLAEAAFLGPTLAADLRRRAGADPAAGVETVVLTAGLERLAEVDDLPRGVAIDGRGATGALALRPTPTGQEVVRVAVEPVAATTDLTRPPATVVRPVEVEVVGTHPIADDDLAAWTALGLATTSADLVGTMAGAVELAVDHAGSRVQYGRAVGSFQAVQHLLADAFVATEGSRSIARHAAWAVDALPPSDALAAAAAAKAYCSRAARSVCESAIQVHGGIGNTWECLAHVHLRRVLLSTEVLGGAGTNLGRVLAHQRIGA